MASNLNTPQFKGLIRDIFFEYMNALDDQAPLIERVVGHLRLAPQDTNQLTALFRVFHNLKGDASLCRFEFGVQLAHHIESILMRVRSGELRFTPMLAEAILLAVDRLELVVEAIIDDRTVTHLRLQRLLDGLEGMSNASPQALDGLAAQLIEGVSGFRPTLMPVPTPAMASATETMSSSDRSADLEFFQTLALQLEHRSTLFLGRTARLLQLARGMNELADRPVEPLQLEAAIYMHDVGMMFLPESVWLKAGRLDEDEREMLRHHPEFGVGLLERMKGWREASRIVAQHHEKPDGTGYPKGLKTAEIHAGAKIMAIADAFESVMLKHSHRGQSLSLLRAAAEINACGDQFAVEWIEPFNKVVRKQL